MAVPLALYPRECQRLNAGHRYDPKRYEQVTTTSAVHRAAGTVGYDKEPPTGETSTSGESSPTVHPVERLAPSAA
jgi:hypothetical protein